MAKKITDKERIDYLEKSFSQWPSHQISPTKEWQVEGIGAFVSLREALDAAMRGEKR